MLAVENGHVVSIDGRKIWRGWWQLAKTAELLPQQQYRGKYYFGVLSGKS